MLRGKTLCLQLFFILIFHFTTTTIESANIKRDDSDTNPCEHVSDGLFIENPKGCEFFFYCDNGEAKEAYCPVGLWFDYDSGKCDRKENVNCHLNGGEDNPEDLDESIACPTRDSREITFASSSVDCGRFFICYHGEAIRQQCMEDLHWNSVTNQCDYPENVICKVPPQYPICPINGQVFFPHPEECHYFIYCRNGHYSVQQCPFYHHWDAATQSCKWQSLVRCRTK